jgi:hypothetical protein
VDNAVKSSNNMHFAPLHPPLLSSLGPGQQHSQAAAVAATAAAKEQSWHAHAQQPLIKQYRNPRLALLFRDNPSWGKQGTDRRTPAHSNSSNNRRCRDRSNTSSGSNMICCA